MHTPGIQPHSSGADSIAKLANKLAESKDLFALSQLPTGEFYKSFVEMCKHQKINVSFDFKTLPHREPPSYDIFSSQKPPMRAISEITIASVAPSMSVSTFASEVEEETTLAGKLYLELDFPDVWDSVTQLLIKDWKIDDRMFRVLMKSCVHLQQLAKIRLFNNGITASSVHSLLKWLITIPNLKILILDNNPIHGQENYHVLLSKLADLREVSFRFCSITDKGAAMIAKSLHPNLLKLNLTGNDIGDEGAASLAQALRLNGTLLSLSLAGNKVGNKGAEALANMLSVSKATAEEVKARRVLLFDKLAKDPTYRKDKITSPYKLLLESEPHKRTPKKSDEYKMLDEKQTISRLLTLQKEWSSRSVYKQEFCDAKETLSGISACKSKYPELDCDIYGNADKTPDSILLNKMAFIPKKGFFLYGNFSLLNINLAKNRVGLHGLTALRAALKYQHKSACKKTQPGLCKLTLSGNIIDERNPNYMQIADMMDRRDPIHQYAISMNTPVQQSKETLLEY